MRYLRTDHGDGAGTREHGGFEQGDHVTVGKGTQVHTIQGFGRRANGTEYADLWRPGLLCDKTVNVDRLRRAS
jgi:hypothetical protein